MAIAKRKKRFFDVEIPIISKTTQLIGFELKDVDGRIIKYDLTRLLRGKNTLIHTKVKVEEDKATSTPVKIELLPNFLKRIVRKGSDYVEDSFSTNCTNAQLQIKPLLVTRRRVSRAVLNSLRKKVQEELIEYVKSRDTITIFEDILKNKLQKELSLTLKKIYPLSVCEIKTLKVGKSIEQPKADKKEIAKKESKEEKVEETLKE